MPRDEHGATGPWYNGKTPRLQRGDAGSIPAGSTKVFKIEAGKNQNPTLDTLKKISKALEVSVDELIK